MQPVSDAPAWLASTSSDSSYPLDLDIGPGHDIAMESTGAVGDAALGCIVVYPLAELWTEGKLRTHGMPELLSQLIAPQPGQRIMEKNVDKVWVPQNQIGEWNVQDIVMSIGITFIAPPPSPWLLLSLLPPTANITPNCQQAKQCILLPDSFASACQGFQGFFLASHRLPARRAQRFNSFPIASSSASAE